MLRRHITIGLLTIAVGLLSAAQSTPEETGAIAPAVRVFGGRSTAQIHDSSAIKFDATLAHLSRHVTGARPDHMLADLRAINPALHFRQLSPDGPALVAIDAVTRGDPQALRGALEALGLQGAAVYSNDVGGWLPVTQLSAAADLSDLHSMRGAISRTRTGAVSSQGDFAQGSLALRNANPLLTGAGVTVGVLSDSFNCYAVYAAVGSGVPATGLNGYAYNGFTADYAQDVSSGDLPSDVNVVEEASCPDYGAPLQLPFSDEGRAMLQIVHDVAPASALAFYTAENSEADFAKGVQELANKGATVIADDVGYFDEPFFQDGIVAQAIDAVQAKGVAYFSAAGNDGDNSYESTAPTFTTPSTDGSTSELLMNFTGLGAPTSTLSVSLPPLSPGDFIGLVLEWDQPYVTGAPNSGGATSQLDLCVSGVSGGDQVFGDSGVSAICSGANALGSDSYQLLVVGNPANASGNSAASTINISIGLANGTAPPGRIKLEVADDGAGAKINSMYATNSPTIQGHPGAAGAVAVGAAFFFSTPSCGSTPAVLESYSSLGGTPILFDSDGNAQTPVTRQKPEVVGPDGGNDTFLGFALSQYGYANDKLPTSIASCQNSASFPNFFGTSAATPHVAALAALMRQVSASLTPAQILTILESNASSMGGTSPNFSAGYGFIQADAVLNTLPPAAPTLTAASSSLTVGASTTLTWSALNATSCNASGDWSGPLAASGAQSVTPAAVGSATYTLTCANAVGSTATSVTLNVVAAAAPHSSGGAMDELSLLVLAIAWALRRSRTLKS